MQTTNAPLRLLASFMEAFDAQPAEVFQVAGREMWVAATVEESGKFCIIMPDLDARITFDHRSARQQRSTTNRPLPTWAAYCAGTLLELGYRQMDIPGANLAIVGSEPPGPRLNYACGMAFAATVLEHHSQHYDDALLLDVVDAMRRDYIK
ncbi:MAG: hypothetical protein H6670_03400 [Anaerolineaceae bacterium]|nr:hypothetical protein [Anaerolineae bacterium]MCB9458672.1 hypothetical protein [Anaerolineaceae bacterium]